MKLSKKINLTLLVMTALTLNKSIYAALSEIIQKDSQGKLIIPKIKDPVSGLQIYDPSTGVGRAMNLLNEFFHPEKYPLSNKKWLDWIAEISKELEGLPAYKEFCQTLKGLEKQTNPLTVGKTLANYKDLLDHELKEDLERMLNTQKMKLYNIVSKRIKAGLPKC